MSSTSGARPFEQLPAPVQRRLAALRDGLRAAIGDSLAAIVVHGSAVRGGWDEERSDVDVLVVLADTSLATLEAAAEPLRLARLSGRVEAMLLKPSEISDATDVFPVFYGDIAACHALVCGVDPFEGLEVPPDNVRVRVEQELREAKIRLRRTVVDGLGSDRALAGALFRKVRQTRGPLHALLRLLGSDADGSVEGVLRACGRLLGVDVAPLLALPREPRRAHAAFRDLMDAAVGRADALGKGGR